MPTRLPLLKHLLSASSVSFCIHELSHFSYNHVSYITLIVQMGKLRL